MFQELTKDQASPSRMTDHCFLETGPNTCPGSPPDCRAAHGTPCSPSHHMLSVLQAEVFTEPVKPRGLVNNKETNTSWVRRHQGWSEHEEFSASSCLDSKSQFWARHEITSTGYCLPHIQAANSFPTRTNRLLHQPASIASIHFQFLLPQALSSVLCHYSSVLPAQALHLPAFGQALRGRATCIHTELRHLPQLRLLPVFRAQGTNKLVWQFENPVPPRNLPLDVLSLVSWFSSLKLGEEAGKTTLFSYS